MLPAKEAPRRAARSGREGSTIQLALERAGVEFIAADDRACASEVTKAGGRVGRSERTGPGRFCPGPVQDQEKVRVTVVSAFHPR